MSRLDPRPWHPHYLVLRYLRAQLAQAVRSEFGSRADLQVVDVGCGSRPYEPLFRAHASAYVGVDAFPGPGVDVVAPAERLPFPDGSFDCCISSQVLEHVDRPNEAVAEINRILKPGGVMLLSTHGIYVYHPNPTDYWRYTHAGLSRLCAEAGEWESITVIPNGRTPVAIWYLISVLLRIVLVRFVLSRAVLAAIVFAGNGLAVRLDRAVTSATSRQPAICANYLVVARRCSNHTGSDR